METKKNVAMADRPLGIQLTADQMNALYFTGYSLIEAGRYQDAANALRFLLLCEPLHIEAWQALGMCHEELDDFTCAAKLFETGFRLGGGHATLGVLAARAFFKAGDLGAAAHMAAELRELPLEEPHRRATAAVSAMIERSR